MNNSSNRDTILGRFLSLALRHNPAAARITLDNGGWADVDALLRGMAAAGHALTMEDLERIVRENNKSRYSFNEAHTKIRANQGHSIPVDLGIRPLAPPPVLYHGTATRFLDAIRRKGIQRGSRQHVHLSADVQTALQVGSRHGNPVILPVDCAAMNRDGRLFYRSENGVWLCDEVPWRYVIEAQMLQPGKG